VSSAVNFADRMEAAIQKTGTPCILGIDPHLDLLPDEFAAARDESLPRAERARAVQQFCFDLIDIAAGQVPLVKPQSALFELLGSDGVAVWEAVIARAHDADLLVIGDVKRGDIASTAAAYARAHLAGEPACDAVTVSPYLGHDGVDPFLGVCREKGAGLFLLVRTSNPSGADIQLHGDPPLAERVAEAVRSWGAELVGDCGLSSVGAVVGATHPAELRRMRALMPHTPFLLPGFGAQGAGPSDVVEAFVPGPDGLTGALVSSSRGISFAHRSEKNAGRPWKDAALDALDEMVQGVRAALASAARTA